MHDHFAMPRKATLAGEELTFGAVIQRNDWCIHQEPGLGVTHRDLLAEGIGINRCGDDGNGICRVVFKVERRTQAFGVKRIVDGRCEGNQVRIGRSRKIDLDGQGQSLSGFRSHLNMTPRQVSV